jgi:hypothetical protein
MHNRTIMIISTVLAVLLWAGLLLLMNAYAPDALSQAAFLLLWSLAALTTATPLSYLFHSRWGKPHGPKGDMARALRQGTLVAMLAVLLMALRFLRMLNLLTAAILCAIVAMVELIFYLRHR